MATRKAYYSDEEVALIEETRQRLGFYVVPEDPEWPIPDEPPTEGAHWIDDTGVYIFRSGKWERDTGGFTTRKPA